MSQKSCCVPECPITAEDGVPLHRFPNPEINAERFKSWISNIGGDLTSLDHIFIYKNRSVCRRHFEDCYWYPRNKLCKLAIPVLYMPAAIYKQEDTITDNDETNINISMKRKNADCSNSTHNYLTDEYSELIIDKTYDDDQKEYIETETEMDLSHFEDHKNCIKLEKENSDVVELVQQVSEDYVTHDSSVGNNVKIKNVDPKVYIKRSKKSEEVRNESLKITNEDLQIKKEIDVNDENKEKIVENEAGVKVDLSIIKQEPDNGFHMQIKEEQNKVDDLEIKKEVEDCNEVLKCIFEVSKLESHFEADDDTNIGAIIAETETRVEPKPKDDIQCDVDSNVLNRNLRTIARVNTFRMEKRKKCHSKIHDKASGDTYNCTKCLCKFESFDRYVSHFFLHDIKPNACPLCETSYESVKPLCNHIRNFHIAKSFVSLRLLNHEFETKDKMKTYKCLVCEEIVFDQHSFNHWEKHFRFKASKQRLGLTSLDLADVDRKLENTFSAKVIKKFKGTNDFAEKDATIIDKGTEEGVQSTCVNSDLQNSIETNVYMEKKSNDKSLDLSQGENEDINEEIGGNQHNSNGGDSLRHVDYEMKCYDSGDDTDTVVVVREELRPGLYLNKYGSLDRDLYKNERMKELVKAKEYYCTKCGVMLWSLYKYVEHLDQKHVSPPWHFACPKCTQVCKNFEHFYGHVRRHIINSFQQLNNEDSEVMDEEISKMVKCIECNLIVEKSRGFAHWEGHLCVDDNTIAGDKEMSTKETT